MVLVTPPTVIVPPTRACVPVGMEPKPKANAVPVPVTVVVPVQDTVPAPATAAVLANAIFVPYTRLLNRTRELGPTVVSYRPSIRPDPLRVIVGATNLFTLAPSLTTRPVLTTSDHPVANVRVEFVMERGSVRAVPVNTAENATVLSPF